MNKRVAKTFHQLMKNGWSPVSYKHHPEHIKKAISLAHFRPAAKQCFANSQKLLTDQNVIELLYAEGIVIGLSGIFIEHAWVIDSNGINHDITLDPAPKIICNQIFSTKEVYANMVKTGCYTPLDQNWLDIMKTACYFGVPTNLPLEEVEEKVKNQFQFLKDMNQKIVK